MTSILEQQQLDVAGRLDSLDSFEFIPALAIRPRSEEEALQIQTDLDQTLAGYQSKNGKSGATVLVQMPTIDVPEPNIPGPALIATTVVRVLENPLVNMSDAGSQLSAESIGLNALGALHHWDSGLAGSPFYAADRAMEPNGDFPGKIVYDVYVRTRLGVDQVPKCPPPRGDRYNQQVSLSAAAPETEIRYTLDGSFPSRTATLYESPIATGGATVRAVAYKPALQPSDVFQI